ncbi:GMP reductase [Leuconostoc carnosum]|uniref:GMP reductase n=1 Tax=Leuconostoc TaxID=1243 RepID=UPI000D5122BA|nr:MULTISPECIES: GMP reductase [Leuconostoc]KAA8362225.1 GMP reductase [Leuconostoc carnosum]KAA8366774.1 GMP reductase [Leuconostoc carnosum]KAA8373780.1 GMP reductase [Leuconostoc carnosum]KAA8381090.1 GMP reductase [Leuconostoc carnosum]MBB6432191.1 GMP reductase [Leuconostoc carnosum]
MDYNTAFDYEDVQLIPQKGILHSRSEADTRVTLGDYEFKLPVVPANMQTVIDESLAQQLAANGYFYVMHRFEPQKRLPFVKMMNQKQLITSISVGIKADEYQFIDELQSQQAHVDYITIDVAHGHSDDVMHMIRYIKNQLPDVFVIAGNVATPEAVRDLEEAGADATKVGVGPGKACITKLKTGFGTGGWQLSALRLCAKVAKKPIITDGGIRYNGDIAKSIRFGATMCMIGSMLAGHDETPGDIVEMDGRKFKTYFGSASQFQKGEHKHVEGKKLFVPYRGSIYGTLQEMKEDLQSAISYAGGRELSDLKHVDYVIVKNSIMNGDSY